MSATTELAPNADYLDRLMRRESFEALWPLFARATKPAKEMTESFSALVHLRPHLPSAGPFRVLHVGDGAHARTAALSAIKTTAHNISVDPEINEAIVGGWRDRFAIERLSWRRARVEDVASEIAALTSMPLFVTFVHAHVDVDAVLERLPWRAAYTLACCCPGKQLTRRHTPERDALDPSVLSSDRRFQVLVRQDEGASSRAALTPR